jgi:C4-type Zn-finger protein
MNCPACNKAELVLIERENKQYEARVVDTVQVCSNPSCSYENIINSISYGRAELREYPADHQTDIQHV